ncbi:hypothetical protein COEREDRAFT_42826 [Coemansia reversa NRRL 1564]|uniref:EamA domain-containing protein n=1 Tax=Coemansia reversa (strain ATCC 12441 / NRRL 1564) TaxID=763665 RepID=A0A2G5BBE5_COERN|nr:hypothetical protein COEREDRAFT_42826 [Coemansia reversa NRRL 1564]|eukprot:PIA16331.1 hypothetical protein COEREDRAFT_42826 [Coemansia reversa NRRL 1564]
MTMTDEYWRRAVGLLLLLCVVFIWVGSSFLVSNLFGEQEFNRPFFITYFNTGTFSLYLLGVWISHLHRRTETENSEHVRSSSDEGLPLVERTASTDNDSEPQKLTVRETAVLGMQFSILWFAANISQNASLAYTSVASSSILCSTSGLFTLAIGAASGVERFNATRLAAVVASVVGVYCIMEHGGEEAGATARPLAWAGDLLALLSAALYGCYTTLLKHRIGDESRLDAPLFFGAVGLANIVLLWPGFFVLDFTGLEAFELPRSGRMWAMVLVNALVGTFLSDYLWLQSMLMTSPLVVTLGLSLTIPLSVAGDVLFKAAAVTPLYFAGALLVLLAFVAANL